jgi:RNA polymerase sigma-70 factor (ECF subfamily)
MPDAASASVPDPHAPTAFDSRIAEAALDETQIQQMIQGSQDALAALYDRHAGAVFGSALRTTRDRSIASEIVEETFLILWNRGEDFDASRGRLVSWLVRIARNRSIDRLRSDARHQQATSFSAFTTVDRDERSIVESLAASRGLVGAAVPEAAPEDVLTRKELRASIDDALATLAPPERRVIALAYDGGLTQSQIAAELNWPIGTVKTRTRRALRQLRTRLEESARPEAVAPVAADPVVCCGMG